MTLLWHFIFFGNCDPPFIIPSIPPGCSKTLSLRDGLNLIFYWVPIIISSNKMRHCHIRLSCFKIYIVRSVGKIPKTGLQGNPGGKHEFMLTGQQRFHFSCNRCVPVN